MTAIDSQTSDPASRPRVATFKPKAFEATTWQVISQEKPTDSFEPLTVTTVKDGSTHVDPMFEDYSSIAPEQMPESVESAAAEPEPEVYDEAVVAASELEELERRYQEEFAALQAEHEKAIADARAESFEQGKSEAQSEAQAQLKAVEENYATLIEDLNTQIVEKLGEVERQAVQFALQVAKKLVGVAVEANPEYIVPLVKEAIELTGGASVKAIRVSPADLELITKLNPERQFKEFDGTWSFVGDETIRHGCVVETNAGSAEYDLEKAWERVKEQILKVR